MDRQSWMQDTLFYSLEPDDLEEVWKAKNYTDENILPLSVLVCFHSRCFKYAQE